jgi:hypothetical protein
MTYGTVIKTIILLDVPWLRLEIDDLMAQL